MAALDASPHRKLLLLAEELHRLADELLRKESAIDMETKRTSEEKRARGKPALTEVIDMIKKLENTAKHMALIDEIQTEKMDKAPPVEAGKAAVAIDENQTEKMDKAPGKAVIVEIQTEKMDKALSDGEKNQFSTIREAPVETGKDSVAIVKNQVERCDESDLPAGKHRLYEDYVTVIRSMPKELPCEIPYTKGDNLAKLMGVTEEWLEQKRQRHREAAARAERISKQFELFQDKVCEEWDSLGYVEVDDEYLSGVAKLQEYSEELCKGQDRNCYKFYDPDLCEQAEGLCSVE